MDADAAKDDALDRRLEEAQLELQRLQDLVEDVPELMEQRFRKELHQLSMANQALSAQRQHLLAKLPQSQDGLESTHANSSPIRRPFSRLRSLVLGGLVLVAVVVAVSVVVSTMRRRLAVAVPPRHQAPASQAVSAPVEGAETGLSVIGNDQSLVELESSAPTWVEVRERGGELLFMDTLNGGDPRRIRLRSGLLMFAARPEMVRFRVDQGPWQPWPSEAFATGAFDLLPSNP